jgi:type 1 fimbria pilin
MAINLPDVVQHNNQLNAIVDSNFVRGGTRSVANLTELYQIGSGANSKVDQLKENVTRVYVSGENKFYLLKNINSRTTSAGWQPENYVYTTGTQTISGAKTFTNLITANQLSMFDVDLFQISGVNLEIYDGNVNFKIRPTVNGSGIQLRGEVADTPPSLNFNGNRNIKRSTFPSGVNAGGSDIISFVNNVFFPTVPLSISLKDSPLLTGGIQNYRITFTGSINGNDESDAALGALIATDISSNQTVFVDPTPQFGNFYYTGSYNVSQDTAIKVDLSYFKGTEKQISQNANISFEYPMYYATGADNLSFNQILYVNSESNQGLRPGVVIKLEEKSDKKIIFNTNNQIMYAIFPSSWGEVTSIKDPNGLENLAAWQLYLQPLNYYVYKSRYYSSVSNFELTFKY